MAVTDEGKSLGEALQMGISESSITKTQDDFVDDRLSQLPEEIIHHILSVLPSFNAAKTGALSKWFRSCWASSPVIDFDDSTILQKEDEHVSAKDYIRLLMNFVGHDTKIPIQKLGLHVNRFLGDEEFEQLIRFVIALSVKEIVLDMDVSLLKSLPHIVFSTRSITTLKLSGLTFKPTKDSVVICCPFIKILSLKHWTGMKNLKVSSSTLREFEFEAGRYKNDTITAKIDINASNLESFSYVGLGRYADFFAIDFSFCKSLKTLVLEGVCLTNECLTRHISKLLLLKSLKLEKCIMPTRSRISSASLKMLELTRCVGLKEVEIEAPKLQSFLFDVESLPCETTFL